MIFRFNREILPTVSAILALSTAPFASASANPTMLAANAPADQGPDTGDIVVSAQKREERLQTVPISASVLSGANLDQSSFVSVADALNTVPGVSIIGGNGPIQGGGAAISIRGVGAAGPILAGGSPISFYIDGLPFALIKDAVFPDLGAFDLSRVEVLRGPQGTLYGASAEDGVVRVLTKDPDLDKFDFKARATGSLTNHGSDSYQGDAAINLPLMPDVLAIRAVVSDEDLGGWISTPKARDANDGRRQSARIKLAAQPTDDLSIGLIAMHQRDYYGLANQSLPDYTVPGTNATPSDVIFDLYGAKISYKFPAFTASSTTSYMNYTSKNSIDLVNYGVPFDESQSNLETDIYNRTLSEEFILNSAAGNPWIWSAGIAYRDAKDRFFQSSALVFPIPYDAQDISRSVSVFGDLSHRILNDRIEWTLGGRFFHDYEASQGLGGNAGPNSFQSDKFNAFTPRVVLSWYPRKGIMVYGSYSQGFRSGFSQDFAAITQDPGLPPLKPDKLNNFELGSKGDLFGGMLSYDASIYYVKWNNVQQSVGIPFSDGLCCINAFLNGSSASGPGLDVGLTSRPVRNFDVAMSFSWNDLTLDKPVSSEGAIEFAQGQRLNDSPKYTASASASYLVPIRASGFSLRLSASENYISNQEVANVGMPASVGSNILMTRASLALYAPRHWSLTLFGDNLTNERGVIVPAPTPALDEHPRPRVVGLQLDYHLR